MNNEVSNPTEADAVTVQLSNANASFRRIDSTHASLQIRYRQPGLRADLGRSSLDEGVTALCEHEIERMRNALQTLSEDLAAQLDPEGLSPSITRKWHNEEVRVWSDLGNDLLVRPSVYAVRESLKGYDGVSDAKLVQETVRLLIEQREENIREIYRKVVEETQKKRRGETAANGR